MMKEVSKMRGNKKMVYKLNKRLMKLMHKKHETTFYAELRNHRTNRVYITGYFKTLDEAIHEAVGKNTELVGKVDLVVPKYYIKVRLIINMKNVFVY